jgi:hypothetical protein
MIIRLSLFCGFDPEPRFLGRLRGATNSPDQPASAKRHVGLIDRNGKLLAVGFDDREAFSRIQSLDVAPIWGIEKVSVSAAQYRTWWQGLSPEQQSLLILDGGSLPP